MYALTWFGSAPRARTPRQHTVRMNRQAVKIAGRLRFDTTTPLVFPTQFTGLPSQWQVSDVYYQPHAGVLRAETYTLTTPAACYLPHIGDLGIWTNAPYIQIHPAPAAAPAPRTTRPATTPARSSTATGWS
jgi:hypothetical protein